jgi:hypothetical protein
MVANDIVTDGVTVERPLAPATGPKSFAGY